VCYAAQENPPEDPQDDEDAMLSKPLLDAEETDENVDNSLSVLFSPHEGQGA